MHNPCAFEGKIRFSASDNAGEHTEYTVPCVYQTDGENSILTFVEPKGENAVATRTRIVLSNDTLCIRRTGDMQVDFTFSKTDFTPTTVHYATTSGVLHFSAAPMQVEFSADDTGCSAQILYSLSYQGEKVSENTIKFEVTA